MKSTLTPEAAWSFIAKAYEQYAATGKRTHVEPVVEGGWSGELTRTGLCNAVSVLEGAGLITMEADSAMVNQIYDFMEPEEQHSLYFWPTNRSGAKDRAVAAALLSEISA